jgi:phenylacetate-CoA ligase
VHRRIDRIKGRSDDMLIIKGVNIFPMQVERVLMEIPEVGTNYRIVLEQVDGLDSMKVQVEVHSEIFKEDMRYLRRLQEKITHDLHNELLVTPRVELVQPNSLPQAEGKAIRVVDNRPRSGLPSSS